MNEVKKLGSILGIWGHPDDESFLTAGLMAVAIQNGQKVACITATRGEQGVRNEAKWPQARLGQIREQELKESFKILGVKYHHWLDYPDGGCVKIDDDEAVKKVLSYIEKYQPDTIITFAPDGLTGHDDHKSVSRWVRQALAQHPKPITLLYGVNTQQQYDKYYKIVDEKFNLYFNIDKPNLVDEKNCDIFLKLPSDISELKRQVLSAQPSQTEAMYQALGEDFWLGALGSEAFVKANAKDPTLWPLK